MRTRAGLTAAGALALGVVLTGCGGHDAPAAPVTVTSSSSSGGAAGTQAASDIEAAVSQAEAELDALDADLGRD